MSHSTHPVRRSRLRRFTTDIPPLGKICATLDGVRRLQRLGYREGLCLCRAIRHDHLMVDVCRRVRYAFHLETREGVYLCRAFRHGHLMVYESRRVRHKRPFENKGGHALVPSRSALGFDRCPRRRKQCAYIYIFIYIMKGTGRNKKRNLLQNPFFPLTKGVDLFYTN